MLDRLVSMPSRLPIVYFHGSPGSPRELALFGRGALNAGVFAPDRTHWLQHSEVDNFDRLAADIRIFSCGTPVHLVAFSLGVRPALLIAARLREEVGAIDLISPAAPADGGDYRGMAGHRVFDLAARSPYAFALLTALQGTAARFASEFLYRQLFTTAQGGDRELAIQPTFRTMMYKVLADSLTHGASGYRADVLGYVAPWGDMLATVTQPTTLWHGDADNWAPPAMSELLAARLANVTRVHRLTGLSHYSTLAVALDGLLPEAGLADAQ